MTQSSQNGRVFGLDLLRAVAIGLVLLCHLMLVMQYCCRPLKGWSAMAGYFGVELFFVLSGFLIGGILIRDMSAGTTGGNLFRFWSRRWLRTLPLFFLFLAINLAINASLGAPTTGWWRHAFFIQNFTSKPGPFFGEAWSLAVEEWFYLLAPTLLFILVKAGLPLKKAVLAGALGGIVAATAWRMHVVAATNPDWLREVCTVVTVRLDACMFGVFAAWWKHFAPESWGAWSKSKLACGILCLAGAAAMFRLLPLNTSFAARTHLFTLTSLGTMLCLPALAAMRPPAGKLAMSITFTSKWSYAMYLVNCPILLWLMRESGRGLLEPLTAAVAATTGLVLTVIASAALHHFYETPILRWRDRRVSPQAKPGEIQATRREEALTAVA
jgi:peptidoglycan/LPS O-acetylase OafA/YrhL